MTGAHLRVLRHGDWQPIEIEYLTAQERRELLGDKEPETLLRWLDVTCEAIKFLERENVERSMEISRLMESAKPNSP